MNQSLRTSCLAVALSVCHLVSSAQTTVWSNNFDSYSTGAFGNTYNDASGGNVTATIVAPGAGGVGQALQLSGNITSGVTENAGVNSPVYTPSGNSDPNLSDYTLSFDLAITHGANAGFSVTLNIFGTGAADGSSYTVPIGQNTVGGGFEHFSVNLGTLPAGYQIPALRPTDGQYAFQLLFLGYNASVTAAPETILLDNLQITTTGATATNAFIGPDGAALHRFSPLVSGINADGANPASGLVFSGGVLIGTTLNGGLQGNGTAFYLSLDGTNFDAFHAFANAPDAGNPQGNLAASGNGFFGTSLGGGNQGVGAIFLGSTNGGVSILHNFAVVSADKATNAGGASPAALLALAGNILYGTATVGGAAANGTVFSLSTNGLLFADLHDFSLLDPNTGTNADGALPGGGLILSGNTLYGTASVGGAGGAGVVFSINTNGGNFTILHNFTPLDPVTATNADGAFPSSGLAWFDGVLYGTALGGGTGGRGVIYSIGANGTNFTALHSFSATDPLSGTNLDGASPCAPLAFWGGYLYGTAAAGGTNASGTVFVISTNGTYFRTIYAFTAVNPFTGTNRDGTLPVAGVLPLGSSLYGTTFSGGPGAAGTVFSLAIPYPPALIANIVQNVNGSETLYFLGGPNSTNVIQSTAALGPFSPWQNIATNTADAGGVWQFTDVTAGQSPSQFYRSYSR